MCEWDPAATRTVDQVIGASFWYGMRFWKYSRTLPLLNFQWMLPTFYREQLREILERKQFHVVSALLAQWCTNVMRSKVKPMKQVARLIRNHFEGIVAWTQTRQTNGFLEALNGLFQAAKRKARGYTRFKTMRTVLFLIAGKLDFTSINPHAA
jgi:hypothetical protein